MKISELQDQLFLLSQTHGDMQIFISDPSENIYDPKHLEEVILRESPAESKGYPHVQLYTPY